MKGIAIQLISSSVALAMMAGGAGVHWWKVRGMESTTASPQWLSLSLEKPGGDPVMTASSGPGTRVPGEGPDPSRTELNSIVSTMEEMVSVLKDLRTENDDLRDQVKEINRDLNEAELRLDSHSESFRPLKASSGMRELISSEHPLLPPKRR
jgi:hypothetical protein